MIVKRQGIICRSTKYGESSLIVDIFSGDVGMRSYIIGGVRSKRGKSKSAALQLMTLVDFVCYDKNDEKNKLLRIKELKYEYVYRSLPFDVIKSSLGLFLLEVTRKAIRQADQNDEIYAFIRDQFVRLDQSEGSIAHFHIYYLIDLASVLGFGIMADYTTERPYFDLVEGHFIERYRDHRYTMDADQSEYMYQYLSGDRSMISVPKGMRKNIMERLIDFYRYHIDDFGELRSLEVIQSLYGS